ncbi:MAG: carbon starvation protein A, partial [Oscillospiraceae bacterium]|nr:carbon starvation protein A [Oscillospiraceae bacterium]
AASLLPVWILLQPRDYLSSYLLYGMMGLAFIGILISGATGTASFQIPAFTGWKTDIGTLFPALFITVACGACSGFHSLVATGTSSRQLSNESDAKPIGYGAMLIESALGVTSLIAVGMVFDKYISHEFGSPSVAFAAGIASMFGAESSSIYGTIRALLTLAVSVFALTSLDTATRLSRFLFAELFLKENEVTWRDASGARRILAHPLFGTVIIVIIGGTLGSLSLSEIWGLFGAANQLLAGLALLSVCAWLGNAGKNNRMFFFPMGFMLTATLCSLLLTIRARLGVIASGGATWNVCFQLIFAVIMVALAVILALEGIRGLRRQAGKAGGRE